MDEWRLSLERREMAKRFPRFQLKAMSGGFLAWHGSVSTIFGYNHNLTLVYPPDYPYSAPVAFAEERLRPGTPHIYNNGALCTHTPQEWDSNCTVVTATGWAAAWFHAYDSWRHTGEWVGKELQH